MAERERATRYAPWDREEKLGPAPWKPDDPKLIAWEKAHGHDVRLKCYPEFGCLLLHGDDEYQALADAAREAWPLLTGEMAHDYAGSCPDWTQPEARDAACPACAILDRLRAALEESEHDPS